MAISPRPHRENDPLQGKAQPAVSRAAKARPRTLEKTTRELKAALERLETTNGRLIAQERLATLGRLAAELAHELRNPLAVLCGEIQLLTHGLQRRPPEEAAWLRPRLALMERATAHILRLIEAFSAASKTPRPASEPVAVGDLLAATLELVGPLARAHGVAVALDQEPGLRVQGDRSQILQVLLNLATNAIEAMPAGGTLTLMARADTDSVILDINDTGPGIPQEIADRIWEPFFTTKAEGTGLGLPIVRGLVEAHGGTLNLSNRPGRGTTAQVRLPAALVLSPPHKG